MGRILAIDYGKKRTGIAVTDTLQIIANGLATIPTHELEKFLADYTQKEDVELFVVGLPTQTNGQPSENQARVKQFVEKLKNKFEVVEEDGVFFCENVFGCEDIPVCIGFYLKLNEYKEYFEQLTYNSYLEGVFNGEL